MTPNQIKVMAALKETDGWLTITDLVKKTGIANSVMHKLMESDHFAHIEKGFRLMQMSNKRTLDVKIFRINNKKSNVSEAISLCKKYKGIYGQLFWSSYGHKTNTTQP